MIQLDLAVQARDAHEAMRTHGHLVLPGFLSRQMAERLEQETSALPRRRTYTTSPELGTYDGQTVTREQRLLWALFFDPDVRRLACAALALPEDTPPRLFRAWIHRYVEGEHIAPHRDAAGDIQLALALHQPARANGGVLMLKRRDGTVPLYMQTGDALLFLASRYEHFATVLRATQAEPAPRKVIAVGRYYFHDA